MKNMKNHPFFGKELGFDRTKYRWKKLLSIKSFSLTGLIITVSIAADSLDIYKSVKEIFGDDKKIQNFIDVKEQKPLQNGINNCSLMVKQKERLTSSLKNVVKNNEEKKQRSDYIMIKLDDGSSYKSFSPDFLKDRKSVV